MLNVIILAGTDTFKRLSGLDNKALLVINGKMMADYVIDAVKGVKDIGKVVIVGPCNQLEEYFENKVDRVIDCDDSIIDKVVAGLKYLGNEEEIIVCCSDIPMVTTEAINDFIAKSRDMKADICYPIIEKRISEKKYPESHRTYVKIRDGIFTGGNLFYMNPKVMERIYPLGKMVIKARKKPLSMAKVFGPMFLIKFIAGGMTIRKIERKVRDITGVSAKAIVSEYPEIGNDVDRPGDVVIAAAYLEG